MSWHLKELVRDRLARQQGDRCAVCRRGPGEVHIGQALALDHCHVSNKQRGLLCGPCNRAIGLMGDDAGRLRAAANYLIRWQRTLGTYPK